MYIKVTDISSGSNSVVVFLNTETISHIDYKDSGIYIFTSSPGYIQVNQVDAMKILKAVGISE